MIFFTIILYNYKNFHYNIVNINFKLPIKAIFEILMLVIQDSILYNYLDKHTTQVKGENAMNCPFCGYEESKVIDSRPTDEGQRIRRRRECLQCAKRFTTYEIIESLPIIVIKKDKSRETFNRDKLMTGLLRACEKRPVSIDTLDNMIDEIEVNIQNSLDREVSSEHIGELVMEKLKKIDEVAYVRFASVYRQFKDINTFMSELSKLLNEN